MVLSRQKNRVMSKKCSTKNSKICYQKKHTRKPEISKLRDFGGERDITNTTATAPQTLQKHPKLETGPVWWSSKNRNFATKKGASVLKKERGVIKIEVVVGGYLAQRVVPMASGSLLIGAITRRKCRKQSNKAKWVSSSKQVNINLVSPVDSRIPT